MIVGRGLSRVGEMFLLEACLDFVVSCHHVDGEKNQ